MHRKGTTMECWFCRGRVSAFTEKTPVSAQYCTRICRRFVQTMDLKKGCLLMIVVVVVLKWQVAFGKSRSVPLYYCSGAYRDVCFFCHGGQTKGCVYIWERDELYFLSWPHHKNMQHIHSSSGVVVVMFYSSRYGRK